jgi:phosphate transport system permease protein
MNDTRTHVDATAAGAGTTGSGPPKPASKRHPNLEPEAVARRLAKRTAEAARFRFVCRAAVITALLFLAFLLGTILINGSKAFTETRLALDVYLDPEVIDPEGTRDLATLTEANYSTLIRTSLLEILPEASGRRERRELMQLVSNGASFDLQRRVLDDPSIIGQTLSVEALGSDELDMVLEGEINRALPEAERSVSDQQLGWIDALQAKGIVKGRFSRRFFTSGDSREPEMAGIWGAAVGSFYVMLVTLALSFPLGVATAVYLEEFAPQNRLTDVIEININNLAAVPSIVFGLLGLALFLNVFHLPRSAPLVGGLVLSLLTLPVIIIASRAALKSVPSSIREAAYGMGASPLQALMHHTLPLALPGMLTGTIIGMARALGETAPLLMIGMVAFIVDVPATPLDPSTALPVQIYLWADSPERAFVTKTSAAILVLLAFLIVMNALAVIIRNRTETRWQ